jgi:hypothetical protein
MITINIDKAKTIAHDKRREARAEEFKPHDEISNDPASAGFFVSIIPRLTK